MLTLDETRICDFQEQIINCFDDFANLYYEQRGRRIETERKFRRVWTCYINGKAEKLKLEKWRGVFEKWLRTYPLVNPTFKCEQYWIDCMLREGGNRKSGDYRILVGLQQENDPKEAILHTRELFDFNIPEKILLIWTTKGYPDTRKIIDDAKRAEELAKNRGVPNMGNIHVLAADRAIRDYWLGRIGNLPQPAFRHLLIPSTY